MHEELASIGKSIVINGELSGSEDLTIEGRVDGKIELRDHVLTVGSNGRIKAQVSAKAIVVLGQVTGNLNATEKVDIKESGSVEGDIVAPRVAIADGSHFRGSIDMQKKDQPADKADKTVGAFTKPESSKTPKGETQKPEPSPVNGEFIRV
jgi:cytoskeletal protein CcmA (bactofilin family)